MEDETGSKEWTKDWKYDIVERLGLGTLGGCAHREKLLPFVSGIRISGLGYVMGRLSTFGV